MIGLALQRFLGWTIPQVFLALAIANTLVALWIFSIVPEFLMRFLSWLLVRTSEPQGLRGDWAAFLTAQMFFGLGWSGAFAGAEWSYVKECLDTGWVSSVGKYVDLFFSILDIDENLNKEKLIEDLNKLKGFFRKAIGSELTIRHTPEVRIHIDNTAEYGVKISSILNQISKKDSE